MTDLLIKSLSFGGFKSFGETQKFEKFAKINLFIGQNNSGKSNVLRFIHEVFPKITHKNPIALGQLDRHFPSRPSLSYGIKFDLGKEGTELKNFNKYVLPLFQEGHRFSTMPGDLLTVFRGKASIDGTEDVWFEYDENKALLDENWKAAIASLDDTRLSNIWTSLTGRSGGSREAHWIPELLDRIKMNFPIHSVVMIPAIRQIGKGGSTSDEFSGEGIIERLVKLQNPDVHNQKNREQFKKINEFLRNVTDNKTATIEIPHERDTILVHMNEKTLPLESLGTGIHEVIILAAAATILNDTVICMEEPELHLNPILQKKLVRYLQNSTSNQYFISTHSAALMDTPDAETYHISLIDHQSIVERVTSDKHRSRICEELGYHPSDLLQCNCIIWVEGPSDRAYLNYWIKSKNKNLVEGIHYSIMFYGGRLASHLTGEDNTEVISEFISLRRLNRRAIIIIDSDKTSKNSSINSTKSRLKEEFDKGPGYSWITKGKEIENYIDESILKTAILETKPSATINSTFGQFENCLSIITRGNKETQASKVEVANYIIENSPPNLDRLDLKLQIEQLVAFILESNPGIEV